MSRRQRTESIIECDACGRDMREHDAQAIAADTIDLCQYCVRSLLAVERKLLDRVLSAEAHEAMKPIFAAVALTKQKRSGL